MPNANESPSALRPKTGLGNALINNNISQNDNTVNNSNMQKIKKDDNFMILNIRAYELI